MLGWGVGGIEAEAVMLGQPVSMRIPEVVGYRLTGRLREGISATDLVPAITENLRELGVVGKFVESSSRSERRGPRIAPFFSRSRDRKSTGTSLCWKRHQIRGFLARPPDALLRNALASPNSHLVPAEREPCVEIPRAGRGKPR